uniref:Golgi transport complex subunit 3 n=1 Tax=Sphaerodactylus townsendi TaxID=933632 RepID=A0ACB8F7W9_9SAUR
MAELPVEIRERLSLWERLPRALAPLSQRQSDSVGELRNAFLCPPAPPELPIEDLSSLGQFSLIVRLTATVPESTEDTLVKGFSTLGMESGRIETAQQFFSWFAQLQTQMDEDEAAKYRSKREISAALWQRMVASKSPRIL